MARNLVRMTSYLVSKVESRLQELVMDKKLWAAKPKSNQVSGPQTPSERKWEHVMVEHAVGANRSGVRYDHPIERVHYGPAEDCPKCEKEIALAKAEGRPAPKISGSRLSPAARVRAVLFVVGITAAAVALMWALHIPPFH